MSQFIPRVEPRPGRLKRCNKCKKPLPIEAFHKRTGSPDGHATECKSCYHARGAGRKNRELELLRAILACWDANKSEPLYHDCELSEAMGLVRSHLKSRRPGTSGEMNGRSKLTALQASEIRDAPGLHREIAAKFGVSRETVSQIKRGENWTVE